MKTLLLILLLSLSTAAQQENNDLNWKLIKEMSGDIPNHPGLTVKTYGAEIARGGDLIKLSIKVGFPYGAPVSVFKDNVPHGFDVSSIERIEGRLELNCQTLVVRPVKASASIYQFSGKRFKSKEPPFTIESGNILATYFCERGGPVTTEPPKLKPKS